MIISSKWGFRHAPRGSKRFRQECQALTIRLCDVTNASGFISAQPPVSVDHIVTSKGPDTDAWMKQIEDFAFLINSVHGSVTSRRSMPRNILCIYFLLCRTRGLWKLVVIIIGNNCCWPNFSSIILYWPPWCNSIAGFEMTASRINKMGKRNQVGRAKIPI